MWRSFQVICRREIENKIKENIENAFKASGYICYCLTRTRKYSMFDFNLDNIHMDFEDNDTVDSVMYEFYRKFFGDVFPEEVFIVNQRTIYYNEFDDEKIHEEGNIIQGRKFLFFCDIIYLYDLTDKERENVTVGTKD